MRSSPVIFVVDDELMIRRAVERVLGDADFHVYGFATAIEALGRIDELRPALIISDNTMPKMTGFDFLRKVREERPEIRTLMLTAGYLGEEIRASIAAGEIDRLLEKPWSDDVLRRTVHNLLAE